MHKVEIDPEGDIEKGLHGKMHPYLKDLQHHVDKVEDFLLECGLVSDDLIQLGDKIHWYIKEVE